VSAASPEIANLHSGAREGPRWRCQPRRLYRRMPPGGIDARRGIRLVPYVSRQVVWTHLSSWILAPVCWQSWGPGGGRRDGPAN